MSDRLHELDTHQTPAATMTRYGGSTVALWRTSTEPGTAGPRHVIDREQVVVVVEGRLTATVAGEEVSVGPGDALVLPASAERQLRNDGNERVVTITAALPGSLATVDGGDEVEVPWSR